jgi:hypothetical protein
MEGIGKAEGGNMNRINDILFGILTVIIGIILILIGAELSYCIYCIIRDVIYWIRGLV